MRASLPEVHALGLDAGLRSAAEETDLSRFEGDFTADGDRLSLTELLGLIDESGAEGRMRKEAIARCLSAGDGWREAIEALGGSFSSAAAETVRLSGVKGE